MMKKLNILVGLLFVIVSAIFLNSCATVLIEMIKTQEKMEEEMRDSTQFIIADFDFDTNYVDIQTLKEKYASEKNAVTVTNVEANSLGNNELNSEIDVEQNDENENLKTENINIEDAVNNENNLIENQNNKIDKRNKSAKYVVNTQITSVNADNYPDSVIINAIVFDSEGNYISGLAPPYLLENQNVTDYWKFIVDSCQEKSYKIEDLKVEEIREMTSPPFSICFVLDHSPSMGEKRTVALQQSVRYATGKIKFGDYISAIKFTDKSTLEVFPTDNKEEFISKFRINGMTSNIYGTGTNILLALDSAAETLMKVPEKYKRIMILFTDGMGGNSNYQEVIKKIRNNDIRVFPICYGLTDIRFMQKLAKDTDGKMFWLRQIRDFTKIFQYIYNLLNNHYRITYKPPICNDLHTVTLNLSFPELGFANVQDSGEYDKSVFNDFVEIGTMTFIDIEFEYNKATIDKESINLLNDLANQLKRNQQIKIQICGHTDDIGSDEYNMQLSLARADAVKNELVKLGIDSDRLSVKGLGKTKPIVPNDSEENRRKNRRTEFVVISD